MHRRRNRHQEVCTFCKRRKVRCDKGQPCATCVKYGNEECVYEGIGISTDLKTERDRISIQNEIRLLEAKIDKLRATLQSGPGDASAEAISSSTVDFVTSFSTGNHICTLDFPFQELVGNNPIAQHDDKVYLNKSGRTLSRKVKIRRNEDPFSWMALFLRDKIGMGVLSYLRDKTNDGDFVDTNLLSKDFDAIEKKFNEKDLLVDGLTDVQAFKRLQKVVMFSSDGNVSVQKNNNKLDPFPVQTTHDRLVAKIIALLPSRDTTNDLIEVFFAEIYPVYPILDQREFTLQINRIIVYDDTGTVQNLDPESKLDFACIGMLLLVLRLSHISLVLRDEGHQTVIPANTVTLAKECYSLFDIYTTGVIEVLQFALMLRIHIQLSPDEGDGDRGSEIGRYNSVLSTVARCMGFHRDPDLVYIKGMDPNVANLSRKIWWTIYRMNLHHSTHNGVEFPWTPRSYDTARPHFDAECLNIQDLKLEEATIASMNKEIDSHVLFEEVIRTAINVRERVDMFKLALVANNLETTVIQHFGRMHETVSQTFGSELEAIQACRLHLDALDVILSILFAFITYYEDQRNLKLVAFYVKKVVVIITYDLIPLSDALFCNRRNSMMIYPDLIVVIQKASIFLFSFFVRSSKDVRKLQHEGETEYVKVLKDTTKLFKASTKLLLDTLIDLSPRYFSAFRLSKVVAISYYIGQTDDFYENKVIKSAPSFGFDFKSLQDINLILNATMNRLRDLRKNWIDKRIQVEPLPESLDAITEVDKIWEELFFTKDDANFPGNEEFNPVLDDYFLDILSSEVGQ